MNRIGIGLVQMRCEKGAMDLNLDATERAIRDTERQGVRFLVFPEASLTGYILPPRYPDAVLSLDDPAIARFLALTRGSSMTVIAGLCERNPDNDRKPFLTQIVARDGQLVGIYRKRTIPDDEADLFTPAADTPIFTSPEIPFGIAVCADINDPQVFEDSARQGAKIIFEVAAPGLYGDQATRNWQTGFEWWRDECRTKLAQYARDNGLYIAAATQAGRTVDEDFPGGGYLFGPDGTLLAETPDGSEGILYVTIP